MEMNLHQHGHREQSSPVEMKLISIAGDIVSRENVRLVLRPVDKDRPDQPVKLNMQHEAEFHLIVVNSQLTSFQHLHPKHDANGNYFVDVVFDQAETYILYADYQAEGYAPQTDKLSLLVKGTVVQTAGETDERLSASTDGLHLAIAATVPFIAGAENHIPVSIIKNGRTLDAADIEPYLGAVAHIILIGREDKDFLHIHPMSDSKFPIIGHTVFPKVGIYRMWVQFKTEGVLHTADFTLNVKSSSGTENPTHQQPGHFHQHH